MTRDVSPASSQWEVLIFPGLVHNRVRDPIKGQECQGTRPRRGSLAWRQRGVCEAIACDWFRGEGWPSYVSRTVLIGDQMLFWPLPRVKFPHKLEKWQCQFRLLCDFVCEVLCVWCSVSVQQRHYHESTDQLTFGLPGWPYTLKDNFKVLGKQWD